MAEEFGRGEIDFVIAKLPGELLLTAFGISSRTPQVANAKQANPLPAAGSPKAEQPESEAAGKRSSEQPAAGKRSSREAEQPGSGAAGKLESRKAEQRVSRKAGKLSSGEAGGRAES